MTSFKVLGCFLILALAAICHADTKCTSVCPDYLWPLGNTIVQNIINHLNRPTPQDGTCRAGTQKYVLYGGDFGYKENRCVCVTTPPSIYKQCRNGVPTCPLMPASLENESVGSFLVRMGQELNGGPADGCCPGGGVTWIAEPKYTGATDNICFCVSQSNLVL